MAPTMVSVAVDRPLRGDDSFVGHALSLADDDDRLLAVVGDGGHTCHHFLGSGGDGFGVVIHPPHVPRHGGHRRGDGFVDLHGQCHGLDQGFPVAGLEGMLAVSRILRNKG